MKGRIVARLFLRSLFIAFGGDAQNRDVQDKPVWALEFIQVTPEKFGMAMGYLDDNWMRVRAEAKKEGAVLDYHRITNAALVTPGHKLTDLKSVVLLTEYKSMDDFLGSERLFDSIRQRLLKSTLVISTSRGDRGRKTSRKPRVRKCSWKSRIRVQGSSFLPKSRSCGSLRTMVGTMEESGRRPGAIE